MKPGVLFFIMPLLIGNPLALLRDKMVNFQNSVFPTLHVKLTWNRDST